MATWDLDEADHFHYLTQGAKILCKSIFLQNWQLVRSTACGLRTVVGQWREKQKSFRQELLVNERQVRVEKDHPLLILVNVNVIIIHRLI